jgi:hypothetical protein
MKKCILFLSVCCFSARLPAQQLSRTHYMMISVFESATLIPHATTNVLVTKEDGTQELTVSRKIPEYSLKHLKENEDSVFMLLKPYFDGGWKLVSVTVIPLPQGSTISNYLTRYFLCREDEK